jgi:hypothetical protein
MFALKTPFKDLPFSIEVEYSGVIHILLGCQ